MKPNLRYLGRRRIGGIIIAFTDPEQRDAYGNYWTRDTDLGLQRYNVRPLYFQHRGDMVEAGLIRSEDLVLTDRGLYMEVDVIENPAGDACLALVIAERGHYSTGVMPGSWREAADGWVELWPWVEASTTDHPATRDGLTRAELIYRFLEVAESGEGDSQVFLRRGPIWWSDGEQLTPESAPVAGGNGAAAAAPAPAAPAAMTAEQATQILSELAGLRQQMNEQPGRVLRPAPLPAPLHPPAPAAAPGAANVRVSHVFDGLTTAGLLVWGSLGLMAGRMKGERETEFMRGLIDKISKQKSRDDAIPDDLLARGALRMIDSQVEQDWLKKGRHIRADEAMQSTYTGYGLELVPTLLSSVIWYHVMLEARVAPALRRFAMPSNPYKFPIVTGGPIFRLVPELADQANLTVASSVIPASKIGTDDLEFDAKTIGALVIGSSILFEDSGVGVADMWSTQMLRQMASALDYTIINGDESATVTNISHYGTSPASTVYDKILAMDGLRKFAFDDDAVLGTAVSQTAIAAGSNVALRRTMGVRGRLGLKPTSLINVVDPIVYFDLLDLSTIESIADFGQYATLLTGAVGQIKGLPIIVSDEIENTNASGQIEDSHDSVLNSHLVVNVDCLALGYMRDIRFEMAQIFGSEGFAADITLRADLQKFEDGAVAYGYNVGGA